MTQAFNSRTIEFIQQAKNIKITRTHSMARHRKSPRSRRNLMVIEGHQFDRR